MSPIGRRLQQAAQYSPPLPTAGTVLARDSFDRADGILGTADVGGVWATFNPPVWSITGGMVALAGGTSGNSSAVAVLPVSMATGTVFVDAYFSPDSVNTGVCLLASADGTSYLNVQLNESNDYDRIAITKRVAGVTTFLAELEPANLLYDRGYSMAVVLTSTAVTVYVEGVNRLSYTLTSQDKTDLAGRYVGLRSWFGPSDEDGASRWDRFLVTDAVTMPHPHVPAVPLNITASNAGSGSVNITWQRPGNGGSNLMRYELVSSDGPTFTINDPSVTSFLATGLNNVSQTFTLRAVNSAGQSAPAVSPSVTPASATAPSSPTAVMAMAGDSVATVSWAAPSNDGGAPVTSYTVTSTPGNIQVISNTTSATVTELTNGISYSFTVTATNSAGTSVASAASNSVTPAPAPAGSSDWTALYPVTGGWQLDPSGTKKAGIPTGTSLTAASSNTISTPGTITDKKFVGRVTINCSGVTFKRCRFENNGWISRQNCGSGTYVIYAYDYSLTDIKFIDCELYGGYSITCYGGNYYERCYFADGNDLMRIRTLMQPIVIRECVFDGIVRSTPSSHCDAIQYTNTGSGSLYATIERCWINVANRDTTDLGNAAIQLGGFGTGGGPDGTVIDNYFDGGNYTINAGKVPASGHLITFRNNRFGRGFRYGPLSGPNSGGNCFDFDSSNVWADTLQPI